MARKSGTHIVKLELLSDDGVPRVPMVEAIVGNRPPPAPPGGKRVSCLGLWCFGTGFRGFSRLFMGAPVAVGFFGLFFSSLAFFGFLYRRLKAF
jgi:hypothetical protein